MGQNKEDSYTFTIEIQLIFATVRLPPRPYRVCKRWRLGYGIVDCHPQGPFFFTSHPIRSILPIRFGQNALHEPPDPKSIFEGFLLTRAQRSKIQNPKSKIHFEGFFMTRGSLKSKIRNPKSILKVFSLHEEENPKSTLNQKLLK